MRLFKAEASLLTDNAALVTKTLVDAKFAPLPFFIAALQFIFHCANLFIYVGLFFPSEFAHQHTGT